MQSTDLVPMGMAGSELTLLHHPTGAMLDPHAGLGGARRPAEPGRVAVQRPARPPASASSASATASRPAARTPRSSTASAPAHARCPAQLAAVARLLRRRGDGLVERLADDVDAPSRCSQQFGIEHEAQVLSAHRMPDEMFDVRRARPQAAALGRSSPAPAAPPTCRGCWPRRRPCRCSVCPSPSKHLGGRRLAVLDRADAGRRPGGDVRDRRGRRDERGAVRRRDARAPTTALAAALRRRPPAPPRRAPRQRSCRLATADRDDPPPATLGILGGGQLGRYFVMAARAMGYRTMVLDPDPHAPAGAVADIFLVAAVRRRPRAALASARCAPSSPPSSRTHPSSRCDCLAARLVHPSVAATRSRSPRTAARRSASSPDHGFPVAPFAVIERRHRPQPPRPVRTDADALTVGAVEGRRS